MASNNEPPANEKLSGSKDELPANPFAVSSTNERLLAAKVKNLERQLETVLTLNLKLKEENELLKKQFKGSKE